MYAIVEIEGQQFKVEKDQVLNVHHVDANEGDVVEFDKVLLLENEGGFSVGTPMVKGCTVSAKVLEHFQGDKVLVFKKKRKKGYQTLNGHRQSLTKIQVEEIKK